MLLPLRIIYELQIQIIERALRGEAEKLIALGCEFHYRTQDGANLSRKKVISLD